MLTQYQTDLTNLLQSPSAPTSLYSTTNLNRWINIARGQLAGETQCIRYMGTLNAVVGQRPYNFSSIDTGVAATTGIAGVIHVRTLSYNVGDGQQWVPVRSWEWFNQYALNNPVPDSGPPTMWSQFKQGSAGTSSGSNASGSLYLDPPPDLTYVLNVDCVCYPIALTDDNTVEAIPYLWTDAVPFFAAYYALLSAQTQARQEDAQRYYGYYKEFVERARNASNPSQLNYEYQGSTDVATINKLGVVNRAEGNHGPRGSIQ